MNKPARYLLIAAGFLIFIIIAPLIILYVIGVRFDFSKHKFVQTGILAVRVDPNNASTYLNGKLAAKGSSNIRFIDPGEYQVDVKKDGYFTWSKRLNINADQISWANALTDKLYLFYSDPQKTTLDNGIKDFVVKNIFLYYLTSTSLVLQNLSSQSSAQVFSLTQNFDRLIVSPNGNLIALQSHSSTSTNLQIFDVNNQTFITPSGLPKTDDLVNTSFSPNNQLYIQVGNQLFFYPQLAGRPVLFSNKISGFSLENNGIYYFQNSPSSTAYSTLLFSDYAGKTEQELFPNIPIASQMQVIVTPGHQVFVMSNDMLYKIDAALDQVASGIEYWSQDPLNGDVIYYHNGEMDYYNISDQQTEFITRATASITNPELNSDLGYSFFIKDNQVTALELDNRDHQNGYILYHGQNPTKFSLNQDASTLYVLDNGELISLKIR